MDSRLVETALIAWSPELRLTRAEGACALVLQTPPAQLVGRRLAEALGVDEARARALDARARAAETPGVEFVTRGAGTLGTMREEERTTLRLLLTRDAQGGAAASVLNVTALLQGAPPVQLAGLSSALSHEIRNPLSSVKMAVQTLARNTTLSERDKRRLTIANREIRTMERMLWLLSEYGRDSAPNAEPVALRSLVQEACALIAPELAERGHTLQVVEDEALPRVLADSGRLRPVLAQLLLGLAGVQAEGTPVPVALRRGGKGSVQLVLHDVAGALTEEDEGRLFEPFGSRLARGAGLSLAALRRVMLNQGGNATASRHEEAGVLFTLEFAV